MSLENGCLAVESSNSLPQNNKDKISFKRVSQQESLTLLSLLLKVWEFVSITSKRSSSIILLLTKLIKLKIKKVSYRKLLENLILSVSYYWQALHYKIIFMNYGLCWTSCCLKSSQTLKCLTIGSIQPVLKKPNKLNRKFKKEMFIWSVSYTKY